MSKNQKMDPVWLSIKLEEYRSLRAEIIDCGSLSISILRFGILAISGLLYFALTNEPLSKYIFLVFCPIICYLILFIWLGEISRIFRAASYIRKEIEKPINENFVNLKAPLFWEQWLREPREVKGKLRLYKWHRASIVLLSLLTALVSIIIGIYKNISQIPVYQLYKLIVIESLIFLIVSISIFNIYRNLSKW